MDPVEVLKRYRTVAVVGASKDPSKWAHIVPKYLKEHGYRIIPINPTASEILGEKAYKSLMEVPEEVEVVEVFRPSEEVPKIAEEVIQRREGPRRREGALAPAGHHRRRGHKKETQRGRHSACGERMHDGNTSTTPKVEGGAASPA
jgi:Predicted CoA-binding protein